MAEPEGSPGDLGSEQKHWYRPDPEIDERETFPIAPRSRVARVPLGELIVTGSSTGESPRRDTLRRRNQKTTNHRRGISEAN